MLFIDDFLKHSTAQEMDPKGDFNACSKPDGIF